MSNIKKNNDIRMKLSSFSNICKFDLEPIDIFLLNNEKIINVNCFELVIDKKKIKYSIYYTNPYIILPNLINTIIFDKYGKYNKYGKYDKYDKYDKYGKYKNIKKLCKKIFLSFNTLDNFDIVELNDILGKKKFSNGYGYGYGYIDIEQSFLILWYIIYLDKFIKLNDKQIYFYLIKYYYIKYLLDTFNFNEIIYGMINSFNIIYKKFYISFYVLAEEFHYKYIIEYLKVKIKINKNKNILFSCNYIKINPQTLLNDYNDEFIHGINSIDDEISNPFGHNFLLIKSNKNKIYYYDPDEHSYSDLYKFKILFNHLSMNFFDISNRTPIQTITDDTNCIFYCIGFIKYIINSNIKLELNTLKLATLLYESFVLSSKIDIFNLNH